MKFVIAAILFWVLLLEKVQATEIQNHRRVACTEIREEPGAPTFRFELVKQSDGSFDARYLNLPGDENAPPEVVALIDNLKCRFLKKPSYLFQCQKFGASVESVRIFEEKLSINSNTVQRDTFREFRAVGSEVPNVFLVYRFGRAATCVVQ